jgi:hypothetical protein
MTFDIIKSNYDRGLWNELEVGIAVKKGAITPEQYQEITGKAYS